MMPFDVVKSPCCYRGLLQQFPANVIILASSLLRRAIRREGIHRLKKSDGKFREERDLLRSGRTIVFEQLGQHK